MIGNRTGQIAGVKRSATGHELRSKLKDSQAMLKVMAMKLADNLEALPEDQLKELKESVLNAYQELVACDLKTEWMDGALQEALERHKDACAPTPDFQFDTFCETIEGELRRRGDAEGNALDATNTQQYKHLRDTLFPQTDEDADFEVMGEVNREAAYKCPITKTRMVVPMKCLDKRCIHRISQEGLNLMLTSKKKFKCPVVGCSVEWVKDGAEVDEDFRLEIEYYYKDKQMQNRAAGGLIGSSSGR